jgi:transglutaminase-like putative cysteine protease
MKRAAAPSILKSDLQWLLVSLALVVAPHMQHLPAWIGPMFIAVLLWRYLISMQARRLPSRWVMVPLTVAVCIGIYYSHGTLLGREGGVSLLVLMVTLKLMETRTRGDVMLIVYMSYFLILTALLFAESVFYSAYLLLATALVTATLVGINHPNGTLSTARRIRIAGTLVGLSIPVMLLLFLLFPRLPAPLWGMPENAHGALPGLSEQMSPGSISRLGQSDEIAFRVAFQGTPPSPSNLYWRGLVLWDFDGRTWSMGKMPLSREIPRTVAGPEVKYTITLEPDNERWLLALDLPGSVPAQARITPAFQIIAQKPVTSRLRYSLISHLNSSSGGTLRDEDRIRGLYLPPNENPRARELAQQWRASSRSDGQIVAKALAFFHRESFVYTLSPPLLGPDPVDDFLFRTRQGFCEHYAGSFVFLMRAAGIPARVVTGYQGGEPNPLGDYMIVRQTDAHAWAEVWLADRGWTRVDPTGAVAPARIERGITGALPAVDTRPLLMRGDNRWLTRLAFSWDSLNNAWNQWVLGYDREQQMSLLSRLWRQPVSWQEIWISLAAGMGSLLLLFGAFTLWQMRARPKDAVRAYYDRFCGKLEGLGIKRRPSEGPMDLARRASKLRPDLADPIATITNLYIAMRYGASRTPEDIKRLRQLVAAFRAR